MTAYAFACYFKPTRGAHGLRLHLQAIVQWHARYGFRVGRPGRRLTHYPTIMSQPAVRMVCDGRP